MSAAVGPGGMTEAECWAVLEHLRQRRERARGSKLYRANTPAELRAIRLTRLWLEFGAWP